jgi:hypothetical protein
VLHFQYPLWGIAGQNLGPRLIGQIVGAFDGVEGVSLPGIVLAIGVIAQRSVDPTLSRPGVGADRVYLREHSYITARVVDSDGGPQPGQPTADH